MKRKILVVDDTEEILHGINEYLLMEGFDVSMARNGKEALSKISIVNPDLMITDLVMNEMTGFELLAELKKNKSYAAMKILVFSARPLDDTEKTELGADFYVLKPANPEVILEHVKKLLL